MNSTGTNSGAKAGTSYSLSLARSVAFRLHASEQDAGVGGARIRCCASAVMDCDEFGEQ